MKDRILPKDIVIRHVQRFGDLFLLLKAIKDPLNRKLDSNERYKNRQKDVPLLS